MKLSLSSVIQGRQRKRVLNFCAAIHSKTAIHLSLEFSQPLRHSSCPLPLSSSVGSENSSGFDYLKNEQSEGRGERGKLLTHVKWP